eukprot:4826889-Amphidinium_carterae.1
MQEVRCNRSKSPRPSQASLRSTAEVALRASSPPMAYMVPVSYGQPSVCHVRAIDQILVCSPQLVPVHAVPFLPICFVGPSGVESAQKCQSCLGCPQCVKAASRQKTRQAARQSSECKRQNKTRYQPEVGTEEMEQVLADLQEGGEARNNALERIRGVCWAWSRDSFGCKVVQKAIQ